MPCPTRKPLANTRIFLFCFATKKIASKSNLTIKIGKQAFYKQLEMPLSKAYAYTSKMMTLNMMAMDAQEGISAFLQKRKPVWKNR